MHKFSFYSNPRGGYTLDIRDDVMMTHYDLIVKRISEKNGEQIPEVGSDTFAALSPLQNYIIVTLLFRIKFSIR